jgi:hypothetical protein
MEPIETSQKCKPFSPGTPGRLKQTLKAFERSEIVFELRSAVMMVWRSLLLYHFYVTGGRLLHKNGLGTLSIEDIIASILDLTITLIMKDRRVWGVEVLLGQPMSVWYSHLILKTNANKSYSIILFDCLLEVFRNVWWVVVISGYAGDY